MSDLLACLGGSPVISVPFPRYAPIGGEEVQAVKAVVESGVLSQFIGAWCEEFYGGKKVRELEREWAEHFVTDYAVAVNSATSGLIAAVGALGIEPGDEVIVSPWTMCASATAILIWNAIPVFADIEPHTFNLDPESVERCVTSRTRAILVTDIFGHAADLDGIMQVARKHDLHVIEDAAQAPGATYHSRFVGTIADIGVYSLNYHKHIHTGEGGICVTRSPQFAERMQLIRNHAEAVVADKGCESLDNMIGFNFRLGEIEAAIGVEQLKKLSRLVDQKRRAGMRFSSLVAELRGLRTAVVQPDCTHVFYVYPLVIDSTEMGVSRGQLITALRAEGVPGVMSGYVNLHRLPMYQSKTAYGKQGFPWLGGTYKGSVSYEKGICPVAERLQDETFVGLQFCLHNYDDHEVDLIAAAFHKVWDQLPALRQ
jgi:dTDP-4-amino-4,6-dideoxygalactose transaminase